MNADFSFPAKNVWPYIDHPSTIEVKQFPIKYGFVTQYVTKKDDKYYMFDAPYSNDGGLQTEEDIDFEEVESREVTVVTWHKVKTNNVLREAPPAPKSAKS